MTPRFCLLTALALMAAPPALAQQPASAPLEISADQGLVWDRAAKTYTAKGRAEAKQGEMRVTADTLTARYADESSSSDIREIMAEGAVVLSSPPYTAHGDRAVYDVATGQAVLTGQDLRVLTPGERLTARDRLTYSANDGRVTAEGNAVLTRSTDSLSAEKMTAVFADRDGSRALDTVTADGGVTIKTARETVTGKHGVYNAATQKAELTGGVVIEQGNNRLEGSRATVDMKTGVSQLYGGGETGRVKGVFYPKKSPQAAPVAATPARPATPAAVSLPVAVSPAPPVAPSGSGRPASLQRTVPVLTATPQPVTTPAVPVPEKEPAVPAQDLPPEPFALPELNR